MDKPVEVQGFSGNALAYVGAFLISFIGLIHLLQVNELFDVAAYLSLLFVANFVGASVAAVGLARVRRMWPWLLGDLISGGAFVGFAVSRLLGLPGYPVAEASWFNLPGVTAFMLEATFLSVSLLAITPQGRKLVKLEEKSIKLELSTEPLEREIAGIRAGMALDLADLRSHVRPQALEKRVIQNARGYIYNLSQPSPKPGNRRTTDGDARSPVLRVTEAVRSHPVVVLTLLTALLFVGRRINGK